MNTTGLEWFGPPERNTLRPLCVVLLLHMNESILCQGWVLTSAGTSLACPFSNGRLPFIAQGDAYTGVETPTGGPNANV